MFIIARRIISLCELLVKLQQHVLYWFALRNSDMYWMKMLK